MAEKEFNTRIVHKHDIQANWEKAVGFIPKQGELIVYDIDENYDYQRIKIGDGVKNVNILPFYNDGFVTEEEAPNLYVWKKYIEEPSYTRILVSDQIVCGGAPNGYNCSVSYSDKIDIADETIVLVDSKKIEAKAPFPDQYLKTVKGKYISYSDTIYFIPDTATFSYQSTGSITWTIKVDTAYRMEISDGNSGYLGYVSSRSFSTYPENGQHTDGYWYKYFKQLGDSVVVEGSDTTVTETDPTVPAWAKAATKPVYTASEVGALPATTVIPDALSDLSEDSTHRVVTDEEKSTWNAKANASDIPTVPTKVSAFENDKGYLTEHQSLSDYAKVTDIPTKVSDLTNDAGYITSVPVTSVNGMTGDVTIDISENTVQYVEQSLTEEQQMQARKNLGLYSESKTVIDEFELTLSEGTSVHHQINFDGDNYGGYADGKQLEVVLSDNGVIRYVLTGVAEYVGNPMYDYSFRVEDENRPDDYFVLRYASGNWSSDGVQTIKGTYQVSVYFVDTIKVPEEYLPDTIAKKSDIPTDAVQYTEQTLTDEQKTQARVNIDAAGAAMIVARDYSTQTTVDGVIKIKADHTFEEIKAWHDAGGIVLFRATALLPVYSISSSKIIFVGIHWAGEDPGFTKITIDTDGYVITDSADKVPAPDVGAVGQVMAVKTTTSSGKPNAWEPIDIPTKVSDFENDSGFATETYVDNKVSNIDLPSGFVVQKEAPTDKTVLWVDEDDETDETANIKPVKGVDYWTEEDKNEIKSYVDEAILGGAW